jgi:hypothetical protein
LALREWISCVPNIARADWSVVDYMALGVEAARSNTRVTALVVDACELTRTFCTQHALWSTVRRSSDVTLQARASRVVSYNLALRIWSAR